MTVETQGIILYSASYLANIKDRTADTTIAPLFLFIRYPKLRHERKLCWRDQIPKANPASNPSGSISRSNTRNGTHSNW